MDGDDIIGEILLSCFFIGFLCNTFFMWYHPNVYFTRMNFFFEIFGWIILALIVIGVIALEVDLNNMDKALGAKDFKRFNELVSKHKQPGSIRKIKNTIFKISFLIASLFSLVALNNRSLFFLFMLYGIFLSTPFRQRVKKRKDKAYDSATM